MFLLVAREPRPDLPYWPGRQILAAADAVLWPLLWVLLFRHAPAPVGLVGPMVAALAVVFALGRVHRAVWANHRYVFTTWRWGQIAAGLVVIGAVLKLTLPIWRRLLTEWPPGTGNGRGPAMGPHEDQQPIGRTGLPSTWHAAAVQCHARAGN